MNASSPKQARPERPSRPSASGHQHAPSRPRLIGGSPARFAATLVLALIATKPAFGSALAGGDPLPRALTHFVSAFAVLWVLGGLVATVLSAGVPGSVAGAVPDAAENDQ